MGILRSFFFALFKLNAVEEWKSWVHMIDEHWTSENVLWKQRSHVLFSFLWLSSYWYCAQHTHALVVCPVYSVTSNLKWIGFEVFRTDWIATQILLCVQIKFKTKLFHIILTRGIFFFFSFLCVCFKKEKMENLAVKHFGSACSSSSSQPNIYFIFIGRPYQLNCVSLSARF